MRPILPSLAAALGVLAAGPVLAGDLGVRGALFPLAETDILELLRSRLEAARAAGQIERLNQGFAARARRSIERPPPVAGLVHTRAPRVFDFDPSILAPRTLADAAGRVFVRAGERINPLQRLPGFDRVLVFIDGDDPAEVAFALRMRSTYGAALTRVILVRGAPLDLMKQTGVGLYFDQGGVLSDRFGLRQVPAVVRRAGERLRIQEVKP